MRLQGFDKVVLVGHSYGCYLVNRLASEDGSGRIAAVVCIGAGFPLPGAFRMRWIFYLPTVVSPLSRTTPCTSLHASHKPAGAACRGALVAQEALP